MTRINRESPAEASASAGLSPPVKKLVKASPKRAAAPRIPFPPSRSMLYSAAKGFLRIMTPGKWIALIIAIALLWKPVSFYFILHDMLRPDWDEVTLITSYDTHGTYTEYTEGNGRDLAVEALSHVRLGPPFVLNLAALYHNGGSESYEVVFAFHTEEGVDRICFHETGQAKGFIQGSGAGYPFPYFFADERYSELLHSSALERTYHGAVKPEEILEPEYWRPEYG